MPYRAGRESKSEYGEASPAIQAFCARSIFTDDPAQRVAIEKPISYAEHLPDFLPLIDDFAKGRVTRWSGGTLLPRRKFQMNGNIEALTSINIPGENWTWPEAARYHRERLETFHVDHVAGLIWFPQHDPRVPGAIREGLAPLGLHEREFRGSGHWPWQIYARQGRRIEGLAIVTQHNFTVNPSTKPTPRVSQPITIGEHSFDIHPCQDRRFAVDGFMEGNGAGVDDARASSRPRRRGSRAPAHGRRQHRSNAPACHAQNSSRPIRDRLNRALFASRFRHGDFARGPPPRIYPR